MSQMIFTPEKPLEIIGARGESYTLYLKGHSVFDKLVKNQTIHPVNIIDASIYGFFGGLPTYLEMAYAIKNKGVSETSIVGEDNIAPSKFKMYDYARDPYKDPTGNRSKFSVFAHLPIPREDAIMTEDGFGIEILTDNMVEQYIKISYDTDYYAAVRVKYNHYELLLVTTKYLEKL